MITFKHKRGSRAVGWPIKLGVEKTIVHVNGRGEFQVPDTTDETTLKLFEQAGHRRKRDRPDPEPKVEEEPTEADWWPGGLTEIRGIGALTAKAIAKEFPDPRGVSDAKRNPTRIRGLNVGLWKEVREWTALKLKNDQEA